MSARTAHTPPHQGHHRVRSQRSIAALVAGASAAAAPGVPYAAQSASTKYHEQQLDSTELERRIRAFILHLDRTPAWRFIVPGADRAWGGDIAIPSRNRDGSFPKNAPVVVWNANFLVSGETNGALVPMITIPVLESEVNTLMIEYEDGPPDTWIFDDVTMAISSTPYRSAWRLKNYRGREIKVVFISSEPEHRRYQTKYAPLEVRERNDASLVPVPSHHNGRITPSASTVNLVHPAPPSRWRAGDGESGSAAGGGAVHPSESVFAQTSEQVEPPAQPWAPGEGKDYVWTPTWRDGEQNPGPPDAPERRPLAPPYPAQWASDVEKHSPPRPVIKQKRFEELQGRIRAFVQMLDEGCMFRGVAAKHQEIRIGDFSLTLVPVDSAEEDSPPRQRWVLEVLVHMKGVWTRVRPQEERRGRMIYPFPGQSRFAFALPGGTLDGRAKMEMKCELTEYRDSKGRRPFAFSPADKWTFSSRAGRAFGKRSTLMATTWVMKSLAPEGKKQAELPPLHVTFALDTPFEVRERHKREGRDVEVFRVAHEDAQRRQAREGRAFE
ncbi:hypothetical protein JCM10449v2_000948 [Rhodotorula kratochvilovae]